MQVLCVHGIMPQLSSCAWPTYSSRLVMSASYCVDTPRFLPSQLWLWLQTVWTFGFNSTGYLLGHNFWVDSRHSTMRNCSPVLSPTSSVKGFLSARLNFLYCFDSVCPVYGCCTPLITEFKASKFQDSQPVLKKHQNKATNWFCFTARSPETSATSTVNIIRSRRSCRDRQEDD